MESSLGLDEIQVKLYITAILISVSLSMALNMAFVFTQLLLKILL